MSVMNTRDYAPLTDEDPIPVAALILAQFEQELAEAIGKTVDVGVVLAPEGEAELLRVTCEVANRLSPYKRLGARMVPHDEGPGWEKAEASRKSQRVSHAIEIYEIDEIDELSVTMEECDAASD